VPALQPKSSTNKRLSHDFEPSISALPSLAGKMYSKIGSAEKVIEKHRSLNQ
jgi:hypothetical protein